MVKCGSCKIGTIKVQTIRVLDLSDLLGLRGIVVHGAPAGKCTSCGAIYHEGAVLEGAERAVIGMLVRARAVLTGEQVRFVRKFLGMTQEDFARRLGLKRLTVTRWEKNETDLDAVNAMAVLTLAAWALGDADAAGEIGRPSAPPPGPAPKKAAKFVLGRKDLKLGRAAA